MKNFIERQNQRITDLQSRVSHRDNITHHDFFAAAALQGILACERDFKNADTNEKRVALAFSMADMAMRERNIRNDR